MTKSAYKAITHSIEVTVEPEFLPDQSSQEENYYVWSYHVTLQNKGEEALQLMSRYWKITDANGHVEEVNGPGVVGEQPILGPNGSFSYTSGTYLATTSGFMAGTYFMINGEGEEFAIEIPAFSLDMPGQKVVLN